VKKSTETICWTWFVEKMSARFGWGDLRCRTIYLLTLVSPMSIPSLSNSPWMRGATPEWIGTAHGTDQVPNFLREQRAFRFFRAETFQVQNNRKPFRCQAMTVSVLTMTSADLQSAQAPDNHAQKIRSAAVNLGRFLGGPSQHTDLVSKRHDLYLERGPRTEKPRNIVERNRHRMLNIGQPATASANLMISERLKFPRNHSPVICKNSSVVTCADDFFLDCSNTRTANSGPGLYCFDVRPEVMTDAPRFRIIHFAKHN